MSAMNESMTPPSYNEEQRVACGVFVFAANNMSGMIMNKVCYNTLKIIDKVLAMWNDIMILTMDGGRHNIRKARKLGEAIIELAEQVNNDSDVVGDKWISIALHAAIVTFDNSIYRSTNASAFGNPFEHVKNQPSVSTSWYGLLRTGRADDSNTMVSTLMLIREFCMNGYAESMFSSTRASFFMLVCRYIRANHYNLNRKDHSCIEAKMGEILQGHYPFERRSRARRMLDFLHL